MGFSTDTIYVDDFVRIFRWKGFRMHESVVESAEQTTRQHIDSVVRRTAGVQYTVDQRNARYEACVRLLMQEEGLLLGEAVHAAQECWNDMCPYHVDTPYPDIVL